MTDDEARRAATREKVAQYVLRTGNRGQIEQAKKALRDLDMIECEDGTWVRPPRPNR